MNVSTTFQPDQFHAMDACWQPPTSPGLAGPPSRVSKGAPQVAVALADDSDMITAAVDTAVNDFAARGYRSLGVARGGGGDGGWKFLAEALAETSIAA